MITCTIHNLDFLSEEARVALEDGHHVQLEINGRPVAVLVGAEDYDLYRTLEDERDIELVQEAKAEGGEYVSLEDMQKELGWG
jgi:PHD/YefM family antitoxin component YafN of YafNO toxin-antitoxin module